MGQDRHHQHESRRSRRRSRRRYRLEAFASSFSVDGGAAADDGPALSFPIFLPALLDDCEIVRRPSSLVARW